MDSYQHMVFINPPFHLTYLSQASE